MKPRRPPPRPPTLWGWLCGRCGTKGWSPRRRDPRMPGGRSVSRRVGRPVRRHRGRNPMERRTRATPEPGPRTPAAGSGSEQRENERVPTRRRSRPPPGTTRRRRRRAGTYMFGMRADSTRPPRRLFRMRQPHDPRRPDSHHRPRRNHRSRPRTRTGTPAAAQPPDMATTAEPGAVPPLEPPTAATGPLWPTTGRNPPVSGPPL